MAIHKKLEKSVNSHVNIQMKFFSFTLIFIFQVWWHDATVLIYFTSIEHSCLHKSISYSSRTTLDILMASARHRASSVVQSRDWNSGLPYIKPTHYYLSYSAPQLSYAALYLSYRRSLSELLRTLAEMRRTLSDLRRTLSELRRSLTELHRTLPVFLSSSKQLFSVLQKCRLWRKWVIESNGQNVPPGGTRWKL